jgi:hypothetical protein
MDQCRTAGRLFLDGPEPGTPTNSGLDGDQAERCDGNLPLLVA